MNENILAEALFSIFLWKMSNPHKRKEDNEPMCHPPASTLISSQTTLFHVPTTHTHTLARTHVHTHFFFVL